MKIKITKQMRKEIEEIKQWFYEITIEGSDIIDYEWGFSAVGILKKPSDHIHKKVNEIFILDVGLNMKGTKIVKNISADLKVSEAKNLMKSIQYVLGEMGKK